MNDLEAILNAEWLEQLVERHLADRGDVQVLEDGINHRASAPFNGGKISVDGETPGTAWRGLREELKKAFAKVAIEAVEGLPAGAVSDIEKLWCYLQPTDHTAAYFPRMAALADFDERKARVTKSVAKRLGVSWSERMVEQRHRRAINE